MSKIKILFTIEQNSGESVKNTQKKPLKKKYWSVIRILLWIFKILNILYDIFKHSN